MTCTFCGSENRPENRFCGMCGVRMERRQYERRSSHTENLRCAACNHVNEAGHRFCGMCGARVDRRVKERRGSGVPAQASASEGTGRAVALANAQLPTPEVASASSGWSRSRVAAPVVLNQMEREEPPVATRSSEYHSATIGGPSFLGLGSDPPSDGEYLLENDSSSRSGLRKLVLLVVLLAIAGLIFVQWRASYHANPRPLEPPKPGPATVPRPEGKNQANPVKTQETENAGSHAPTATDPKNDRSAPINNNASTADAAAGDAKNKDTGKESLAAAEGLKAPASPPGKEEKQVALKGTTDIATEGDRKSSGAPKPDAEKETPSPRRWEKPSLALTRAQRYLQGRGVRQNCEQGMMYLKAATAQNDPNAAVQMAALYASGHCVQQDRVKAYQWFSTAYSQEPNNQWIAKNMDQLWGQMTPQQRRQFQ